jgi:hypothetical protein
MEIVMLKYFLLLIFSVIVLGQKSHLKITNINRNQIYTKSFKLSSDETLKFTAIAPKLFNNSSVNFIWILDAKSRQAVWTLEDASSRRTNKRSVREYTAEIELDEGSYEIYFSTFVNHYDDGNFWDIIGAIIDDGFSGRKLKRKHLRMFYLELSGNFEEIEYSKKNEDDLIIFSETKVEDDFFKRIGFDILKPTKIDIYALGEIRRSGSYDYAWISNAETLEKVWEFTYRRSSHAGGGSKNRIVNTIVELNPGKYIVSYVSDDSHSYDNWNVAPPYDPESWGITVKYVNKSDRGNIETFEYKKQLAKNILLDMTKAGDDEYFEQAFEIQKEMDLRIYALGEGRKYLDDYAWIINADTRELIWKMYYDETEHAGGSSKNRLINTTKKFKEGRYVAYYKTDDSHSFERWNSERPYNFELWGLSLYALNKEDIKNFKTLSNTKPKNIISQLVKVRNDIEKEQNFELDKATDIIIYAIGEGSSGEMYDYGYITDAKTGSVVWKMMYENTNHAGGARKNRVINDHIRLNSGKYILHYVTDDSHAYKRWNSRPPHDTKFYGITVIKK